MIAIPKPSYRTLAISFVFFFLFTAFLLIRLYSEISKNYGVNGLTEVFGIKLLEDLKFSQRLYPHIHDTIGFYFCLIKNLD